MTHGFGSFARYSSFGTSADRFHSKRDRFLCLLSRTPTATFRIGVSRDRASFAGFGSPVGEYHHFLCRFCRNVDRFSALPDDADLALGMGLECPGTCGVASACQYWIGDNLQIQDCEAILP